MIINKANLDFFFYNANQQYQSAYEALPTYWQKVAMEMPSSTRETHYGWIGQVPSLREWVGPRVVKNLQARGYVIQNRDYEETIGVSVNDLEDDQFGLFSAGVKMQGEASKAWPDQLIASMAVRALTENCFDGQPFFYNAHPVDMDNAGGQTYQNRYDSSANGGGVSFPLTVQNFATVWQNGLTIQGEGGRPLNVQFDTLMVPPQLATQAKQVIEADYIAQAIGSNVAQMQSNVWKGAVELLVNPYLSGTVQGATPLSTLTVDPNRWYLLCTKRAIKPFVFQQRKPPTMTPLVSPTDPNVVFQKEFIWAVSARGNTGVSLPFLAATASI